MITNSLYTVLETVALHFRKPSVELPVEALTLAELEHATHVIDTIVQQHVVRLLTGVEPSSFATRLYEILLSPEEVVEHKLLRYVPDVYKTIVEQNRIVEHSLTSNYVGEVGAKIKLDIDILRCVRIDGTADHGTFYVATAADKEGNLFSFSPKSMLSTTTGYTYKVSCRVKKHNTDMYMKNAKVTYLNYVKEQ